MTKIGFIGAGNIATAIIGGISKSGYITTKNIYIYDVDSKKCDNLSTYGVYTCNSVKALAENCSYIFLTVKPQVFEPVLRELCPFVEDTKVIVSVGAGITINYIKEQLRSNAKVIRVMPNTPLLYGNGATALVKTAPVLQEEFDFVRGIFNAGGVTCEVEEALMDAVTGVTGSSPAFIFRFAKELISAGVQAGMAQQDATAMVIKTLLGSAVMLQESGLSADALIQMVASPNGTTVAGLNALDETGFDASIHAAVNAAIKRSAELRK